MGTWAEDVARELRSGRVSTADRILIRGALSAAVEVEGNRKRRDMVIGDIYRIKDLGMGAKYMNGLRVRVESVNIKTIWVRLLQEDHNKISGTRFGRGPNPGRFRIYPQNLELAYLDGVGIEVEPRRQLKRIEDFSISSVVDTDGVTTHYKEDGSVDE